MGASTPSLLVSTAPLELLVRVTLPRNRLVSLHVVAPPFVFFTEHTCHLQAQQSLGRPTVSSRNLPIRQEPLRTRLRA